MFEKKLSSRSSSSSNKPFLVDIVVVIFGGAGFVVFGTVISYYYSLPNNPRFGRFDVFYDNFPSLGTPSGFPPNG